MSGITPILDTLLHQVLGRREGPVVRSPAEQPVGPARAARAAAPAHSDSRLDPRPPAEPGRAGGVRGRAATAPAAGRRPSSAIPVPQGASLRLGAAARAIADLLARFPAPSSALRPGGPLMQTAEPRDPAHLAARLRDSVESSGLFHEAHLRRWDAGRFPLPRLLREPQTAMTRSAAKSAAAPAGHSPAGPGTVAASAGTPPASVGRGDLVPAGDGTGQVATPSAHAADAPVVHPALEHLVRHQLELLANAPLRWEGEPWAGVFMAWLLQPPPRHHDDASGSGRETARNDDRTAWHSQVQLTLPALGEVAVRISLAPHRLTLQVEAGDHALPALRAGVEPVRGRLRRLGFDDVVLELAASAPPETGHE